MRPTHLFRRVRYNGRLADLGPLRGDLATSGDFIILSRFGRRRNLGLTSIDSLQFGQEYISTPSHNEATGSTLCPQTGHSIMLIPIYFVPIIDVPFRQ
jgi:hypothetical protein